MSVDLISPIDVIIKQIDKQNTPYPAGITGRKYPGNQIVRDDEITISAQVVFGDRDQKAHHTQLGTNEKIKGYIVVRYEDLTTLGITIQRGDKIIQMGQLVTKLFLTHSSGDPAAHIGGVFNLVRLFFADRNPVG